MAALITECCGMAIGPECRFCPKCGYEARVEAATLVPPAAESGDVEKAAKQIAKEIFHALKYGPFASERDQVVGIVAAALRANRDDQADARRAAFDEAIAIAKRESDRHGLNALQARSAGNDDADLIANYRRGAVDEVQRLLEAARDGERDGAQT